LLLHKIAQSTSLADRSPVASDVKAVISEAFSGTMHREVKPSAVPSFEVQIEIRLFGRDPPNVAPWLVIVGAQDDQDLAFAHELMLGDLLHAVAEDEPLPEPGRSYRQAAELCTLRLPGRKVSGS
jgi:hypothetical protein